MHLNYYTAVGTKLLKQQGRAKAAKAAATQQLGRGRGEGLSPFLQLVVTELLRLHGREQRIPVPLAFLEGSSEQEGRKQKGSEGSSSAGWGKPDTRDCAHDHVGQEYSCETEQRESGRDGREMLVMN